jgi:hypothetical protein
MGLEWGIEFGGERAGCMARRVFIRSGIHGWQWGLFKYGWMYLVHTVHEWVHLAA